MTDTRTKVTSILQALVCGFILTALLLLLLAFLLYQLKWGADAVSIGIKVVYILSCLIPGLLIGRKLKNRRFLWGGVVGALYFLILFGTSLLLGKGVIESLGGAAVTLLLCTGSGIVGGMIS